jgi:hypothetical protein
MPFNIGPLELLLIVIVVIAIVVWWYRRTSWSSEPPEQSQMFVGTDATISGLEVEPTGDIVVESYPGRTQGDAGAVFDQRARFMASRGYYPISQSWAEGRPGVARVIAIGVFSTAIRPAGFLTVTYRREEAVPPSAEEKVCPMCAESVKAAARICRFCGHEFTPE